MEISPQELQAIYETFSRLEARWVDGVPDNSVWHAWSPLPPHEFLPPVREASRLTEGRRFLDLGCGIGTKLAYMHALGWSVAGVEHHRPYFKCAEEMVPEADLTCGRIQDQESFDADLIYMYRPAVSLPDEEAIERYVFDRASKGALVFLPARPDSKRPGRVSNDLWRIS